MSAFPKHLRLPEPPPNVRTLFALWVAFLVVLAVLHDIDRDRPVPAPVQAVACEWDTPPWTSFPISLACKSSQTTVELTCFPEARP